MFELISHYTFLSDKSDVSCLEKKSFVNSRQNEISSLYFCFKFYLGKLLLTDFDDSFQQLFKEEKAKKCFPLLLSSWIHDGPLCNYLPPAA